MAAESPTATASGVPPRKGVGLPGITRANAAAARRVRWVAFGVVVTPLAGLVAAIVLLWNQVIGVTELTLLIVFYSLSTFGVCVGFHRLASHRSFQTYAPIRALLAILGSMAGQGPVLFWAANHRRHHKYSDQPGDPHSPNCSGDGLWGTLKGIWHVHMGWLFAPELSDWGYWIPDLLRDRTLFRVNQWYFLWLLLGLAVPAAVGGLVSGTGMGALLGLLWGGLVRIFLLHHTISTVNSVSHLWGTRPYQTPEQSRNNALVALLTYGEGWHNNHHAFPASAYQGLEWWQVDWNGLVIRLLWLCGLAWDVKCPSASARRDARRLAGAAPGMAGSDT
jgi:stearoyl-CoA desaturase (delta-9 desaturase)